MFATLHALVLVIGVISVGMAMNLTESVGFLPNNLLSPNISLKKSKEINLKRLNKHQFTVIQIVCSVLSNLVIILVWIHQRTLSSAIWALFLMFTIFILVAIFQFLWVQFKIHRYLNVNHLHSDKSLIICSLSDALKYVSLLVIGFLSLSSISVLGLIYHYSMFK